MLFRHFPVILLFWEVFIYLEQYTQWYGDDIGNTIEENLGNLPNLNALVVFGKVHTCSKTSF